MRIVMPSTVMLSLGLLIAACGPDETRTTASDDSALSGDPFFKSVSGLKYETEPLAGTAPPPHSRAIKRFDGLNMEADIVANDYSPSTSVNLTSALILTRVRTGQTSRVELPTMVVQAPYATTLTRAIAPPSSWNVQTGEALRLEIVPSRGGVAEQVTSDDARSITVPPSGLPVTAAQTTVTFKMALITTVTVPKMNVEGQLRTTTENLALAPPDRSARFTVHDAAGATLASRAVPAAPLSNCGTTSGCGDNGAVVESVSRASLRPGDFIVLRLTPNSTDPRISGDTVTLRVP